MSADDYFADAERARTLFARLIGGNDPDGVALVPSVSYGVALAAKNVRVDRGNNVVITHGQFPSNVYSWTRFCAERGATLRTVEPCHIAEAIDSRTAVVAIGTIDWTDGTLNAIASIGVRAREVDAAFVLDGTQSIGALPFDVEEIRPDFLLCSSYKWLLGPMGLGLCHISERFRDGIPLEETWLGRRGSEDFRRLTEYTDEYQPGARRFDTGGRAQFVLLPMLNAALSQLVAWDPHRVQDYCGRLAEPLHREGRALGFGAVDGGQHALHLFAIRPPEKMPAERLFNALKARGVYVSLRGDVLRVSINVHNTMDDMDVLVDVLREYVRQPCHAR